MMTEEQKNEILENLEDAKQRMLKEVARAYDLMIEAINAEDKTNLEFVCGDSTGKAIDRLKEYLYEQL